MVDLHRHDEYSAFDGFGKAEDLVKVAKKLGHSSFATSNHGNTNGLVKHYYACKDEGIKPILGSEVYFMPKFEKVRKRYHLCIYAKNLKGYRNLNEIVTKAEEQKYYKPIVTMKELEDFNEGVICTSGCVAGFAAQLVVEGKFKTLDKYLLKMKKLFGEDFYVEIQPYKISEPKLQEKVNVYLIKYAKKHGIKCILTSDSHYGSKENFDSYLKMHEIGKHDLEQTRKTYKERYMPSESQLKARFVKMHSRHFKNAEKMAEQMIKNLEEIESKVEVDILDQLDLKLPVFNKNANKTQFKQLVEEVKNGLKQRGKYNKEYIDRAKEELDVIKHLKFENYFLIVQDYVRFSKANKIPVGPGRGSGCNSIVNYALGITDVDSIYFGLDFRRFLRKDKVKMPDIDLDFATNRRKEVMDYLMAKYKGKACQISNYGLYKVDNLINDLAKVSGLDSTGDIDKDVKARNKKIIAEIKGFIKNHIDEEQIQLGSLMKDKKYSYYNSRYDNIIKHFTKLYKQVRFIGTHAAGVIITDGNILDYTALRKDKNGGIYASYDLTDMENINTIKFDILGLGTMESIGELREATGESGIANNEHWVKDKKVIKNFLEGNTQGIFQFEKATAKNILAKIKCSSFDDIVATSAMNRPGPLTLKMPEQYATNKANSSNIKKKKYWEYTKETHGTIVYQEQIQGICVNIGHLPWPTADKIIKMQRGGSKKANAKFIKSYSEFLNDFIRGAVRHNFTKKEAKDLFDNFFNYSFNKGHSVGYSLISVEEMFYKTYYPLQFWLSKLRIEGREDKLQEYRIGAVQDDCIIFLPHVNGSKNFELKDVDGEYVIQEGLQNLKGIGEKTAEIIIKNGPYIDLPDFEEKMGDLKKTEKRAVTKKTIEILKDAGALEFREKVYMNRCLSHNSFLYSQKVKDW